MNEFQIAKEVFLSIVKWFLVVLLLNNLIWAILFFGISFGSDTSMSVAQDGRENYQEVNNG